MSEVINPKMVDEILRDVSKEIKEIALGNLKGVKVINSPWKKIYPDEENSPLIRDFRPGIFLLLYPRNSCTHSFTLEKMSKRCHIIIGEVYEENCDFKLTEGQEVVLPSGQEYKTLTRNSICLAMVEVLSEDETYKLN